MSKLEILPIPTMLDDMPNDKNIAIIVAAGSGSRFGGDQPKQYLNVSGKEVLSFSVESFSSHPLISQTIIVCSNDYMDHVLKSYPNCIVVTGGETRQDSVHNGLAACPADTAKVLVHDAARPLIPKSLINDSLNALDEFDGVAPVIQPSDSMILLEADGVKNLRRDQLRIVQTPQCFRFEVLSQAHGSGLVDTDEIGLVRQAIPEAALTFIDGHPMSMKITHASDLDLIDRYLNEDLG